MGQLLQETDESAQSELGSKMHRGFAVSLSDSHKGFLVLMTVNYFILVLLVAFHFLYFCFCCVLHILSQSHNMEKCSLFMCWFLCSAKQEEPVGFNPHGSNKTRFSHSPSLQYSYSRGELLALILVLCLLGLVLVHIRCLYNFSFNFPWSRDIKHVFYTSRSACV